MSRDERLFKNYSESYLLTERARLQRLMDDAAAGLGMIKTEFMHRAIENAADDRDGDYIKHGLREEDLP